jgi:hypothetical protein
MEPRVLGKAKLADEMNAVANRLDFTPDTESIEHSVLRGIYGVYFYTRN